MAAKRRFWPLCLLLLFAVGLVGAQEDDLKDHPGSARFDRLKVFDEENLKVEVSVKGAMIRLVAEATRESDPELAAMLDRLMAVEVQVFSTGGSERSAMLANVERAAEFLEDRGWSEALTVRVKRAYGHVYLKMRQDTTAGLAAVFLDGESEAVLVNIVGEIDPAEIGRLARRFNIDVLSDPEVILDALPQG